MQFHKLRFDPDLQNFKLECELSELKELLRNKNRILDIEYLNLAFILFAHSFDVKNVDLKFLTLMNAMEVLFHPSGNNELKYRISRYFAVLIGETKEESEDYFENMKKLYDKRSNIVHSGKTKKNLTDDLFMLRDYVRKSIIKLSLIIDPNEKEKDERKRIEKVLDASGFGDNPFN